MFCRTNKFLKIIIRKLNYLEDLIMANQSDVQAAIDAISTQINTVSSSLTDFSGDFTAAIAALQAQIGTGSDLQPQVDALTALGTKLATITSSLAALDTTAEGISGTPTPGSN